MDLPSSTLSGSCLGLEPKLGISRVVERESHEPI